jgi:hypothetical protein
MRTSFHHQPEAQHLILQLSTSWQADYPIFWHLANLLAKFAMTLRPLLTQSGHHQPVFAATHAPKSLQPVLHLIPRNML